jgi:hypothetical protein
VLKVERPGVVGSGTMDDELGVDVVAVTKGTLFVDENELDLEWA